MTWRYDVKIGDGSDLPNPDALDDIVATFGCDRIEASHVTGDAFNIVGFREGRPLFSVVSGIDEEELDNLILPALPVRLVSVYDRELNWLRLWSDEGNAEVRRPQ